MQDSGAQAFRRKDTEHGRKHWEFVESVARRVKANRPAWMAKGADMCVGDVIPITFTNWKNPPKCSGEVVAIDHGIVHFVYTADSEAFSGLRGMLRLPGWTKARSDV